MYGDFAASYYEQARGSTKGLGPLATQFRGEFEWELTLSQNGEEIGVISGVSHRGEKTEVGWDALMNVSLWVPECENVVITLKKDPNG